MSIRFGFWFYARVIRASIVSGQQQSIAWVEFGYYFGMILGLIVWTIFKVQSSLSIVLLIDGIFQLMAGLLDIKSHSLFKSKNSKKIDTECLVDSFYSIGYIKLATMVVLLTIGVQVIIFNLCHHIPESVGVYFLALFYGGVALAAYFSNKKILGLIAEQMVTLYLTFLMLILFLSVLFLVCFANSNYYITALFIIITSFLYEMISLVFLNRIGYEEKHLEKSGLVINTYAAMGIGSAISLWLLSQAWSQVESACILSFLSFAGVMCIKKRVPISTLI